MSNENAIKYNNFSIFIIIVFQFRLNFFTNTKNWRRKRSGLCKRVAFKIGAWGWDIIVSEISTAVIAAPLCLLISVANTFAGNKFCNVRFYNGRHPRWIKTVCPARTPLHYWLPSAELVLRAVLQFWLGVWSQSR